MPAARNPQRGVDRHNARLTPEIVREIRANRHGLTLRALAEQYRVHLRTVEKAHYYETWRHVL